MPSANRKSFKTPSNLKSSLSLLFAILFHKAFNRTFNAYSNVIVLDEEGSELLFDIMIGALWIFATLLVIYYLFNRKKNKE